MCGITGGISFAGDFFPKAQELARAADYLSHRGPDGKGDAYLDGNIAKVALAHTRLSIIDLSSNARQPMHSSSGKSSIVFNGEVYNYLSLRHELQQRGFIFHSRSDTEVILNAFECWGIKTALRKMDGMFAFALFDHTENKIIIARDLFGKKPLYFYATPLELMFSSDIRSFSAVDRIPQTLDLHALGYFFSELSTPHTDTIWKEIKKLKPGHFLVFGNKGVEMYEPFHSVTYSESCSLNWHDLVRTAEDLLEKAVKKRLVSDVPVAALLSGGIDSSLVVAKMAHHSSNRVRTYSVGFNDEAFNELPYARQVSDKFQTEHTELVFQPQHVKDVSDLIGEFGEPFADSSMLPMYWISKEVARSEKVVLGGDGGDELFGGYNSFFFAHKYDAFKKFAFARPIARAMRSLYSSYNTNLLVKIFDQTKKPKHELLNRCMGFDSFELRRLLSNDVFTQSLSKEHEFVWNAFAPGSKRDLINLMSASLKTRLLNDYLVKVDRATMYASLEMRSPFLDKDLAEFAATLKPHQLFHKNGPKSVLKEIATKHFSKDFVNRNKMGFSVPLGNWFKQDLAGYIKEVVIGGKQNLVDFDYRYIEQVIQIHCSGAADQSHKLWALFVFHIWANQK